MNKLVSVVIPMYFEEQVAKECYKRLYDVMEKNKTNYEFIFVNDGSTDKTLEILEQIATKDDKVKIIDFSRNFGHQIAVTAGIDAAIGDAVVLIDADLQDPPELIPDMIKLWESGYDVVYAQRKKRKGESIFKLFTAKCFYRVLNKMTDVKIPVDTGDFRLMDRKVVDALKKMPERGRFIRGMVSWLGFKQIPIMYDRDKRFAGKTKYPLGKMIKFAYDAIFSFSSKPVKMVQSIGIFAIFISFCLFLFAVISKITEFNGVQPGWSSLMAAITFFGGVQTLSIGIIGEYIARIYEESKARPLYLINKKINIEEKNEQ